MKTTDRIWQAKKSSLVRDLRDFAARSPVLKIIHIDESRPDRFRAIVCFEIPTLVAPRSGSKSIRTEGPVIVGLRYERDYVTTPPVSWDLVTIFAPAMYHPNSAQQLGSGGGLCLGDPQAAINMSAILHLTYAALTLQSFNSVDWRGLNPMAADYVRRHVAELPIVDTGFLEEPPPALKRPLDLKSLPFHFLPTPLPGKEG